MATKESTRQIIQQYEGGSEDEGGIAGWTSDEACLQKASDLNDQAVAAWYLWKEAHDKTQCQGCDRHPRLTVAIVCRGLDAYPHVKFWSPLVDAAAMYSKLPAPPERVKVWRYDTGAGRMLRQRSQPYARARAHGVDLAPRGPRLGWDGLDTVLESVSVRVDEVHAHHEDGAHCPTCPTPHRPHPSEGAHQGAMGTGPTLHRVHLWTPSTTT